MFSNIKNKYLTSFLSDRRAGYDLELRILSALHPSIIEKYYPEESTTDIAQRFHDNCLLLLQPGLLFRSIYDDTIGKLRASDARSISPHDVDPVTYAMCIAVEVALGGIASQDGMNKLEDMEIYVRQYYLECIIRKQVHHGELIVDDPSPNPPALFEARLSLQELTEISLFTKVSLLPMLSAKYGVQGMIVSHIRHSAHDGGTAIDADDKYNRRLSIYDYSQKLNKLCYDRRGTTEPIDVPLAVDITPDGRLTDMSVHVLTSASGSLTFHR